MLSPNDGARVEVLYFDGCPSHEQLQPRLELLVAEAGVTTPIELRRVESVEAAQAERFLGSPTVRVNGRDVEPDADQRRDFGLKCRLYRTEDGASGVPPDEWITAALSGTAPEDIDGAPDASNGTTDIHALAAAIGAARPRFDAEEQRVALTLYRLLGQGTPVDTAALAERSGLPTADVAKLLDGWPEVFRDDGGRVVAFGGLSLEETRHRMRVDGRQFYTWCAWDTLFVPSLLGQAAEVTSRCPVTRSAVELSVTPDRVAGVDPVAAVLSMRAPTECCVGDDLIARFCQHVHFFASQRAAEQWLAERDDGFVLSIEQGFELGQLANRTNFGDALD